MSEQDRVDVVEPIEVIGALDRLRAPDLRASNLCVAGLRLGDPAAKLDSRRASAAFGFDVPCLAYSESSSGACYIQREGEPKLRPYPLAERVADVVAHGGWIELDVAAEAGAAGSVRAFVEHGRITDIHLLPGAWLAPLELSSRAVASMAFGRNDRYARCHGKTTWAWPERALAVVWNDEKDQLEAIALGERACACVRMFEARDLVVLAMQWTRLLGDEAPLRADPSNRYMRVMAGRLVALLRAFGLESLPSLCTGTFLGYDEQERVTALLGHLERAPLPFELPDDRSRESAMVRLPFVWSRMFTLRRQIEAIDAFNEGVWVASGLPLHVVELGQRASAQLDPVREHLDRAMTLIVDPAQRRFSWGQLVREYGFPDEDFDQSLDE